MENRWTMVFALTALGMAGMAWLFPPESRAQGKAVYLGRSTSAWHKELKGWEISQATCWTCSKGSLIWCYRSRSPWDQFLQRIRFATRSPATPLPLLDGDPDAIPVLVELLEFGDEKAQLMAIEGLRRMGDAAKPAVPALVEAMDDKNQAVSADAAIVLYGLDKKAVFPDTPDTP